MVTALQLNASHQHAGWNTFVKSQIRPETYDPADMETPARALLDIDTNPPSENEVRIAIKALKNGKACGVDSIHAEMGNQLLIPSYAKNRVVLGKLDDL